MEIDEEYAPAWNVEEAALGYDPAEWDFLEERDAYNCD